jgi:hypothetical protein
MQLFLLFQQYGPLILVAAFLLWDGRVRETRVSKHITRLESEYHQRRLSGWPLSLLSRPRRWSDSLANGAGRRPG